MGARKLSSAELDLPDSPAAPLVARRFVADWWTVGELRGDLDGLLLLTSEVVTNSLQHARGPRRLKISGDTGHVRVAVTDHSTRIPTLRPQGADGEMGRGLHLVNSLALAWGHDMTLTGKSVWFIVRVEAG